jgi:hypothetical protein
LTALIAAYLNRERAGARARTLREFVAEFYGLSASAKQKAVLEIAALPRRYLHDLIEGNAWREEEPERLLEAMQRHAKRVNPKALGVLGRDHLSRVLCEQHGCEAETVSYKKVVAEASGLPFVLDVACGVYRSEVVGQRDGRVMTGINWSATLTPPFEHLGADLNTALVQRGDPVVVVVHLAIPRPTFRDRGKQALTLPEEIEWVLEPAITQVTRLWTTAKRRAYRSHRAEARADEEMRQHARPRYPSVKAAAYQLMEQAYLGASGQGQYVAHARQIMYAARRQILAMIDPEKAIRGLNGQYFTQTLVPDFMLEHPDLTAGWDVVFDDRGHFREPHRQNGRECMIGLGTLAVRTYTASWTSDVEERINGLVLPFDVKTNLMLRRKGQPIAISPCSLWRKKASTNSCSKRGLPSVLTSRR